MNATLEGHRAVTKRRKRNEGKPKRVDKPAKIDAEIHRMAASVAAFREIPLAKYLSELLQGPVSRDFSALSAQRREE